LPLSKVFRSTILCFSFGLLLQTVAMAQNARSKDNASVQGTANETADAASGKSLSIGEIARRCSLSIPIIVAVDDNNRLQSVGSGYVIAPGIVATCAHVIANRPLDHVGIAFEGEPVWTGNQLVLIDWDHDLAFLKTNTTADPLTIDSSEDIQVGDPVVSIGSPMGFYGTVASGIFSHWRTAGGVRVLQTTAFTSSGSSGGALLNQYGKLVGMTASIVAPKDGNTSQGIFLSVSAAYIADDLTKLQQLTTLPSLTTANPGYVAPETQAVITKYGPIKKMTDN